MLTESGQQFRPRKRFGQHFLRDSTIIHRIVDSVEILPDDSVVEIGPGHGALTALLADRCSTLHLVEIDRDLAASLRTVFADKPSVTVHQADVLEFGFAELAEQCSSTLVIVGNLPYNISTALLMQLLAEADSTQKMVFMVQREIADRLTASPGSRDYGRLTVMIGRLYNAELLFEVSPAAFTPPPRVYSAVVRLIPRSAPLGTPLTPEWFERVVRDAFSQRRKTVRNALRNYSIEEALAELRIDPMLRPECLSIEQFTDLAAILSD